MEALAIASDKPERPGSATWVRDLRVGALSAGAASTVLIALRLLSVAKFNPETAYGILQASGTAGVIMGTVIGLIPSIAIIAGLCLALSLIFGRSRKLSPAAEFAVWASMTVLVLIALLTIPVRYSIAVVLCVLFVLVVWRYKETINAGRQGMAGRVVAKFLAVIIADILISGVVISPPWMPAEHLTFKNTSPVTGYILSQTTSGVTVLQAKPRRVIYYDQGALIGQAMCSNAPAFDFPVIYYVPGFNPVHYDNC